MSWSLEVRLTPTLFHYIYSLADGHALSFRCSFPAAGPAGMMASLCCNTYGLKVLHIDERDSITTAGRADGIQPRTLEVSLSHYISNSPRNRLTVCFIVHSSLLMICSPPPQLYKSSILLCNHDPVTCTGSTEHWRCQPRQPATNGLQARKEC